MRPLLLVPLLTVVGLSACAGGSGAMTSATEGETSTATGASTSTSSTDGMGSTTMASSSGSTGVTNSSESDGCGVHCPDLASKCPTPEDFECDVWTQGGCCEGEKCTAWANDGGGSWNANRCVPVGADPDKVGEPCTADGGGVSGLDSCEAGAVCWWVDVETDVGVCVAFCHGVPSECDVDPASCCAEGFHCTVSSGGNLVLCLPDCDPLAQDCPYPGLACYPGSGSFHCAPDISGNMGAVGDVCDFDVSCDPGSFCGPALAYPGCNPDPLGCCIPFCPLDDPACAPGTECLPFYDPNDTPPGYENVGACMIPP